MYWGNQTMIKELFSNVLLRIGYKNWSPVQKIASSFLMVILVGAFMLMLPISNQDGQWLNFIDALFTSTSATCVTGLVTRVTADQFTVFGQIIIIFLMQIGGLGLMTFMAVAIVHMKHRLSMNDKIVMREMLNQDTLFNMNHYVRNVLKYTFYIELIGFALLSLVFVPDFGLLKGMFTALFTSVSAFCNAGFDIIGAMSLMDYATNPIVNFTIMALIISGGLGFAVWFDLRHRIRSVDVEQYSEESMLIRIKEQAKDYWKGLHLHTKMVVKATIFLIVSGTIIIYLLESQNVDTLGTFSFFEKWMIATFQSVTLRTAGFATINLGLVSDTTKLIMSVFMFIGGSPGGTAGGVKTTTVFILVLFVFSQLKNRDYMSIYKRSISKDVLLRAVLIVLLSLSVLTVGVVILTISEQASFIDLLFEATSAIATVGLTTGITPSLTNVGKIVIILLMYLGRIGVITMVLSVIRNRLESKNKVVYPSENVIVG